jgi:hypothetical protein
MTKKRLNTEEKYNLTNDQIGIAERYLKQYGELATLTDVEARPLYEMRLLDYSYADINYKNPNVPMGKLLLTAALKGWERDAENLAGSILDRIKTKMVRSTVEQVDILTGLISVFNSETTFQIKKYLEDPDNNKLPSNRIGNFKELQITMDLLREITNTLTKMASTPDTKQRKALPPTIVKKEKSEEAAILASLAGDDDE